MVDLTVRISNSSQNFILLFEVAINISGAYLLKKQENRDYQIPVDSLNERPGLQRMTYSTVFDDFNE